MSTKILILGPPGSGKSTAADQILEIACRYRFYAIRLDDYEKLQEMFLEEMAIQPLKHRRFRPIAHGGFDIIDFTVLDEALMNVKRIVLGLIDLLGPRKGLIIIEFARDEYSRAFEILGTSFLQDAYFICLHTDINTCRNRIHERVRHPNIDNHFVSDNILSSYYQDDPKQHLSALLMSYVINEKRIYFVDSKGSNKKFLRKINTIVSSIISSISIQDTYNTQEMMRLSTTSRFAVNKIDIPYTSQNTDGIPTLSLPITDTVGIVHASQADGLPITRPGTERKPITCSNDDREIDSVPERSSPSSVHKPEFF